MNQWVTLFVTFNLTAGTQKSAILSGTNLYTFSGATTGSPTTFDSRTVFYICHDAFGSALAGSCSFRNMKLSQVSTSAAALTRFNDRGTIFYFQDKSSNLLI